MSTVHDAVKSTELLYRLRTAEGELLYVGITRNWPQRMTQHQADKPWWSDVRDIEIVAVLGTRQQVEAIEKAVIKTEAPTYNKTHAVLDDRTDIQLLTDAVNEAYEARGIPPLAGQWCRADDGTYVALRHLLPPRSRRLATHVVGWVFYHHDDERKTQPMRCAWGEPHECTSTVATIATGVVQCYHGPMAR